MSIGYDSIESLVKSEVSVLKSRTDNLYEVRQYSVTGGQQSTHPWATSGLYFQENSKSRLVLEVFAVQSKNVCVVRVYREEPFETLFARKLLKGLDALPMVISNGLEVFRNSLPLPSAKRSEDAKEMLDQMSFSDEQRKMMHQILSPIPPPINLNEIEPA